MPLHKTSSFLHSIGIKSCLLNGWLYMLYLEHLAGDIDVPFNLQNVVEVHRYVVLKSVYSKTVLSYTGQPWPEHQHAHCHVS